MSETTALPWPKAILFDLDGTLVDSVPDLTAAVNHALKAHGHAPLAIAEVRTMIGNGIPKLVERAFAARNVDLDKEGLGARVDEMMGHYMTGLTNDTVLMPGAFETLVHYHRQGVLTGVITNKPQQATEGILAHFGLDKVLDIVMGGDSVPRKKPSPDMIVTALEKLGIAPLQALVVGDSAADVGAARAAGVPVVVVEGGYTNIPPTELNADRVIPSLDALPGAIDLILERE